VIACSAAFSNRGSIGPARVDEEPIAARVPDQNVFVRKLDA
jgi:hypothetical protein